MKSNWMRRSAGIGFLLGAFVVGSFAGPGKNTLAAQPQAADMQVGADNIGGTVTSSKGPEAGVWVIAETTDFQTKMKKIVVTDDRGRFLIPELPKANYKIWVRGYGLVDSTPVTSATGKSLALTAVVAPDPRAAAHYYPPNYWLSMVKIPPKDAFPMKASEGGKMIATQGNYIDTIKSGCQSCHILGDQITRDMPMNLGTFPSTNAAWKRRIMSGQLGQEMLARMNDIGYENGISMFSDWTDRITAGEVPPAPPRPLGLERNIVLTEWDFAGPASFLHGVAASNRYNPHVNANGPVFNGDWHGGTLLIVDPQENTASSLAIPLPAGVDRKAMPTWSPQHIVEPSPYWGDQIVMKDDVENPKNNQIDKQGRVWINVETRPAAAPAVCKASNGNVWAKAWMAGNPSIKEVTGTARMPWESPPGWGLNIYDPKTQKFDPIDLCFGQGHAVFANDKDQTLYFSLRLGGLGWFDSKVYEETHDAQKAQGFCAPIIDYNGDGKAGVFTLPNEPPDPKLDRLATPMQIGYGVAVNPVDGSVWYAATGPMPGKIIRAVKGSNPPATCQTEVYEPPFNNPKLPGELHYTPRGVDVDSKGLVWTALAGSGELASFDRRKCKVMNGPTATGQQCPEGWTFYPVPGPKFGGTDTPADWHYLNWVDRYNTLGLGVDAQVVLGTGSDSLQVFKPDTKEWFTIRVPYPMGLYTRDIDGRIDDTKTGWKGRGLWTSTETRVVWHTEGGKGQVPQMVHFQLRPDPLAK